MIQRYSFQFHNSLFPAEAKTKTIIFGNIMILIISLEVIDNWSRLHMKDMEMRNDAHPDKQIMIIL